MQNIFGGATVSGICRMARVPLRVPVYADLTGAIGQRPLRQENPGNVEIVHFGTLRLDQLLLVSQYLSGDGYFGGQKVLGKPNAFVLGAFKVSAYT